MRRFALALIAGMLTSCATSPTITGPFSNRATQNDISQIEALTATTPKEWPRDWKAPVSTITFVRPDRAKVLLKNGDRLSITYEAEKRAGTWTIKPYSAEASGWSLFDAPNPRLEEIRPQIGH